MVKKKKNGRLMIAYFLPILHAHKITSSLRYVHTSNYQNSETMVLSKVLTFVLKNYNLQVAGFLDLPLVIEKIDLSLQAHSRV